MTPEKIAEQYLSMYGSPKKARQALLRLSQQYQDAFRQTGKPEIGELAALYAAAAAVLLGGAS